LISETRDHEVGIVSNRESASHGEYLTEPCTYRPSRSQSWTSLSLSYLLGIAFKFSNLGQYGKILFTLNKTLLADLLS